MVKNLFHTIKYEDFFLAMSQLFGWLIVFISPVRALMTAIMFLAVTDLITALWVVIKKQEKVTSVGLRKTINKILAYEIAVVLSYTVETVFQLGVPVVRLIAGLIAVTELKSNLENLYYITGLDYWQKIVDYMNFKKKEETKAQLDLIRAQEAGYKIELADNRIDTEHERAVIAFTKSFLADITLMYENLELARKRRLQSLMFPEGVYISNGKIGTHKIAPSFELIKEFGEGKNHLVTPTRFELVLSG